AIVRIAERAFERVLEHELEERGRARREALRDVLLEIAQQGVLASRVELRERLAGGGARVRVERREPGRVCGARRGERVAERAVDVPGGAGFERAGAARVTRDQARHDRLERARLGRTQSLVWLRGSLREDARRNRADHSSDSRPL